MGMEEAYGSSLADTAPKAMGQQLGTCPAVIRIFSICISEKTNCGQIVIYVQQHKRVF